MANPRGFIVLGAALLIGGAAAKGASVYVKSRVAAEVLARAGDVRPQGEMIVVARDLPISSRIRPEDVEVVRVPLDTVPPTAMTDTDSAIGRLTRMKLFKGEALLEPKLAPKGAKGGLQAVIPDGMRAMTVKVNDVVGVDGFVLPGSRVDIVAVIKQQHDQVTSKVVLQNIEVLAVDQVVDTVDDKPRPSSAITLVVTPADSEKLTLAVTQGEIRLVMRAFADETLVSTPGVDAAGMISRPVTGGVSLPSNSVEVIENDRRTKTSLPGARASSTEPTPDVKVR